MANTYTKIVCHFVFSTVGRSPMLTEEIRKDVFAYMGGIIRNQKCASLIVNGIEDHVHILAHVRPTLALSDFMREVKASSSGFVHRELRVRSFAWQEGFSAFSVRGDDFEDVRQYIARQAEHHKRENFESELRRLLVMAGVDYKEQYLLG